MPRADRHRQTARLSDRSINAIRKPGVYPDGAGLALHVLETGTRSWRYRYRLEGRAGVAVLGNYPDMSLAKARAALEDARADVDAGVKPALRKWAAAEAAQDKTRDDSSTFGAIAERWFAMAKADAWADSTATATRGRMDMHLKPTRLWAMSIRDIKLTQVMPLLDKLHADKPDTSKKVKLILNGIFSWAHMRGIVEFNPMPRGKPGSGQMGRKVKEKKKKLPATTKLAEVGRILRAIEHAQASWQVRGALHLCAMTAQRPGRVVAARWSEFQLDGKNPTWTIPRELQKVADPERGDHVVPLAPEVVAWLKTLPSASETYVFASPGGGHVSLEAPSKLLRTSLGLAGKHTPHGFRSTFSTLANAENRDDGTRLFDRVDIEHVLDHELRSEVARTYDRARALPRLRVILEWWAITLSAAKADA